jgi:tetratricopeptide (TPR) repeat protein
LAHDVSDDEAIRQHVIRRTMSRSIHVTRQTIAHARRFRYANRERRVALLDDLETRYLRKRRMKWAMRQQLGPVPFPGVPVTADQVAISFDRRNSFARYPVSEADLRSVLGRLPLGVLDGLNGISFSLGAEYQRNRAEEWDEQDPVVRRFGHETLPSVYCGLILGVCFWDARRVQIYGFVSAKPLEELWAFYLRLHMLATLVHEIAHHEDRMKGWARDRWTGDDKHKTEWYAESRQLLWVETVVIPYLQETYPAEVALLEEWMQAHIGLVLPLRILAGDARIRAKKHGRYSWRNAFGGSDDAFEEFVRAVDSRQEVTEARLDLAIGLHRAEELDYAQEIIAVILAEHPDHVPTLVQKGWICCEQKCYEEALKTAEYARRLEPANTKVLDHLAQVYADIGSWDRVLALTTAVINILPDRPVRQDAFTWRGMRILQARAYIALGEFAKAQEIIVAFGATGFASDARMATKLQTRLSQAIAGGPVQAWQEVNDGDG